MRARSNIVAIALVSAVTAGGLLTACGPTKGAGAAASPSGSPTSSASSAPTAPGGSGGTGSTGSPSGSGGTSGGTSGGSGSGSGGSTGGGSGAPLSWSGPGVTGLTVSNGTDRVLIDGNWVDFGVVVRDLAWSPDGSKAAFIDGSGNLDVADPDGSDRVTVARNPGNLNWSHPAWQVIPVDNPDHVPAADNLFFVSGSGGRSKLLEVPATAVGGTPKALGLNGYFGTNTPPPPTTGNTWISGAGTGGSTVYANSANGGVYIRDDYLRQMGSEITTGSEPAMDADGQFVFVRSVAGRDHVFMEQGAPSAAVDLTPNATVDCTEPALSADGSTVAFRTPQGIVVLPTSGSGTPRLVTSAIGLPAYRA